MRDAGGAGRKAWFLAGFMAASVGLSVSLLNVLLFHAYPLWVPEVGLVLAAMIGVAVLFASALAAGSGRWCALAGGVLALLLADLALESLWLPVVIALVGGVAAARMGIGYFRFVAIAFAIIGVTGLIGLGDRRERVVVEDGGADGAGDAPLLVHLILDEFEGMRGLDALPGQEGAGSAVADALMAKGFTVYRDAYSPYYRSRQSIPAFLDEADWFAGLERQGYSVRVVQSSFLDLCDLGRVDECRTYWRDNLNGLREADLSARDRAHLLLVHLARGSVVALAGSAIGESVATGRISTHAPLKHVGEANGINSLKELERIEEVVAGMGAGEAMVAHVLVPHFPYAHDERCRARRFSTWRTPWDQVSRESRAAAYMAQVTCTVGLVERIASAAERASGGRYVMIVQGDHGSRIGAELKDGALAGASQRDLLHAASTLFAVRLASPQPGTMNATATLGELLNGVRAGTAQVPYAPRGDTPKMRDGPTVVGLEWKPYWAKAGGARVDTRRHIDVGEGT